MSHRPGDLPGDISNLIDLLRWRAARQPDQTAFTFLVDGEHEALELTYGELDRRARAIAARLQHEGAAAQRAILLYPPGLEYIAAFFGCLYAGTIAVPAYPPRFNRNATRLQAIVADAQATIALTTAKTFTSAQQQFEKLPDLAALRWHSIDAEVSGEDAWREPARNAETLAFLQYTSGSTGTPKGVMLSHGNLLYNLSLIYESFEINAESVAVSWLPPYHDMGLIAGIMLPIYANMPTTLMSPAAFLQRPLRWLEAISRVRATHSGGPNFAYELCVERSTPEQRANLDLSSWTLGLNGAEPIRRETLDRFSEAFAPVGFRREVFYPAYGLAEASLIVAGGARAALPIVGAFDSQALENNRVVAGSDATARVLVGCGTQLRGQEFRIVDPETSRECQPDQIGEIWVRGPSVAQGYWNRPEATEQTFHAYIAETGDGPFLRTGDLGFLNNGELFVTGRLKDLIIIRGRNHYPQDIEQTVARSHPALRLDYGAAFAVEIDGVEQLVVVQEIDRQQRHADLDAVISAIRRDVAEQHDLQVYSIALLKHGSIPKTSSGKIQRHTCRSGLRDGTLDLVKLWTLGDEIAPPVVEPTPDRSTPAAAHKTGAEIQSWLIAQLAERLKIPAQSIDVHEPFASYGLDSVAAIGIAGALEEWLARALPPTLVYDYPNIAALASYLADEPAAAEPLATLTSGDEHEPIAIIGLGCRMPGAADPDSFWQLLREGVDAIAEVPAERWEADALYDARAATAGKMSTRWGGFLDQVDRFDAQFFGVAPREAVQMDPQQRLLLEVAWEALENAGQIPEHLAGNPVGVFVGISASDYSRLHQRHGSELDAYIGVGNALSIAANRLSYLLDFRGPSIAVDTACSSSLVALHLACQSLRRGESSMALAGGVNLILTPDLTIAFSQARMMSSSGRCKTFDADADGYVRGEGCGVIVLKRLRDAIRDNDPILAVVRGTAVNQDGRSNGLTAPNAHAQQAVIRQALADAQLEPKAIGYVEAHGTGTPLGDPIELQALSNVLHED
ncbi:MAG: AMP-binding protein, partial [Chloroflexi bacterium]|nr:AMP-binding protein [Chloroflexota bacterium]